MNTRIIAAISLLASLSIVSSARAEEVKLEKRTTEILKNDGEKAPNDAPALASPATPATPAATPGTVTVSHVPLSSAKNGGGDLAISASIGDLWRARAVRLFHRAAGKKSFEASEFKKDAEGRYLALVPNEVVNEPGFDYYIETELRSGARVRNFASAEAPQHVVVRDLSAEERTRRRLARHQGTHDELLLAFRYVGAGVTSVPGAGGRESEQRDSYNQLDVAYTHRILSDYIYQIGFGFGILGAKLGMSRPLAEAAGNPSLRTGVYLGRAKATWEFADAIGFDATLVLGANQAGFVVGGGGALRFGRLTGTHLEIGVEGIQQTGYDAWLELAWDTVPGFMMSLRTDLTSYPSSVDGMAVLPSFNVKWMLNKNVTAGAFIGYGTRFAYARGGVSTGMSLAYQF